MIIQNLNLIFCNFIILIIYQKFFNLKLSKLKFILTFFSLNLIFIFIETPLTILFILIFSILTKSLKFNTSNLLISSIIVLFLYNTTTFISNILSITNFFFSITLIFILLIIIKLKLKFHLTTSSLLTKLLDTIILISLIFQILNIKNITLTDWIFTIITFSLFIYTHYLVFLNIKKENELKNLNLICDSTRAFKHDFNNIMHSIGGYIKTNNINDLKNYYDKLIPECFCINNLHRFHSELMQNPALYSVISNKYNLAEKNNIKMSLNISTNLNNLKIDDYSLTRIIGILIDNSIEASKECNSKIINISFEEHKNKQSIIIENTFKNKNVSLQEIYEKEFTTKTNNSGLGLWEVKKILNNHKNILLETNINNDFFIQELEIL